MEACLYDEQHGFYGSGAGVAGRRGDFITSVEVGPLFGAVLARWLDDRWFALGRPDPFHVGDVGAGPGTLARSLRAAEPACGAALDLVLVERSLMARSRHDPRLARSLADFAVDESFHVIVANELLDNLPVRLLQHDGSQWLEVWVRASDAGDVEELRPVRPLPTPMRAVVEDVARAGVRVPVAAAAAAWVEQARRRLLPGGSLLVFDYGASTAVLAARGAESWLRTYCQHQRGSSPLEDAGAQDITCEVPFDQLPAGARLLRQDEWLRRWGIEDLVEAGRRVWAERAGIGDLAALRARSRVREAEALVDPDGLGAFCVLEW